MRVIKGLAASLLTSLALAAPSWAETLADALVSAYKTSDLLTQNQAVLRAADEDVAIAMSSLRPVVSWAAQAGYTWRGKYPSPFGPGTVPASGGLAASISLTADMMLYDFGRRDIQIKLAKESVLATRQALVGVEQQVLLQAVAAYMDVRSAAESVGITDNSVRVIRKELRAARDRFEVGEITATDVSMAEARAAGAEAQLAAAQGQLAAAREAYLVAVGHKPGSLAKPPKLGKMPKTLEEAKAIAQREHPQLKQLQHEVKAAELRVEAAAAERMPTIGGRISLSTDTVDSNPDTAQIGIQAGQTIYAGGRLSAVHRKAMAGRDAVKAGLLQASAQIGQRVGQAWANIAVARAQISAIDQQIEAAKSAYAGVTEEAALGARTTLDVLDAEQTLLDARASRIQAEANLQVALYSLLASMGVLTAEDLNLGIATYDAEAYYNLVRTAPTAKSKQGSKLDAYLRSIGSGN